MRKAITTSTTILPIALVVGSVLWILPEAGNLLLWGGWFVALLTTYGWMEMNARMILLRERSRMVSTTVFASLTAIPLLHYAQWESLCLLSRAAPRGIPLLCLRPIEHLQFSTYPTTLATATAAVLLPHPIALTDFRGTFRHRHGDNPPRHHPSTYKYME